MLGYAATTDIHDVPVVVADGDRTARSRELISRFDASPNFSVVETVTTVNEIEPFLERGTGVAGSLDSRRLRNRARAATPPATVQVVADGTDSNSTTVALGYATSLIGGYAQELIAAAAAARRRRPSMRASGSGTTRGSRAGSS